MDQQKKRKFKEFWKNLFKKRKVYEMKVFFFNFLEKFTSKIQIFVCFLFVEQKVIEIKDEKTFLMMLNVKELYEPLSPLKIHRKFI